MVQIERWKIFLILAVCFFGLVFAAPNLMKEDLRASLPSWMPSKTINLGLDLQGGVHLLLDVDVDGVIKERVDDLEQTVRREIKDADLRYKEIKEIDGGVRFLLREPEGNQTLKRTLRNMNEGLLVDEDDAGYVTVTFNEQGLKQIQDETVSKSIEVIRRRVDEDGTKEPIIQRQGDRRIILQVPGAEDPSEVKSVLEKTAKLSFHLVDTSFKATSKTLPMIDGGSINIKRRAILTGDMLVNASPSFSDGSPVVSFKLNAIGAKRFCDVTRKHTGSPFAIVLDDEVISAPNIQTAICGGQAIITGRFTVQEVNDLSLLLRAGALPADLNIAEERTVGPSLGADSVEAGKKASLVGMVLILIFMALSYGRFGLYANVALMVNMALIFAMLSGLQATLTLPGIAGIVLTIGMAVDANVLIFERIREELSNGRSPLGAVDSGYSRAMSTIIDSNLTTLIAAFLLFSFGTGPVKGFAVTLGIGIITSFFSAIMVTRLMVVLWMHSKKPKQLKI